MVKVNINSKFLSWLGVHPTGFNKFIIGWAISSAAERFLHTEEVAGSRPASPTNSYDFLKLSDPG